MEMGLFDVQPFKGEEKASRRLCDILFLVEREKIMRERADEQNTVKVEPGGTPVPSLTHQNAEELLQVARLLVKAYDVGDSESIDWGDLDLAHTAAVKALEGIEGEMPNLIKRFTEIAEKLQDLSILDDIVHGGCDEDASKAINDEGLADDESAAEKIYDEYSEKAADINNEGSEAQIKAILQNGWVTPEELEYRLTEALPQQRKPRQRACVPTR